MRLCDIIETYISGDWGNDEPTEDACCSSNDVLSIRTLLR